VNGGSSQPSISPKLSVDALGQVTEWLSSSTGKVTEDVTASSAGGEITLEISSGTYVLDSDGKPLRHIYIKYVDLLTKATPINHQAIYMYELSPEGATFSKPVEITINYNPLDLPKSPDQLILKMYYFLSVPEEWIEVPCLSEINRNEISFSTDHLSIYVLSVVPKSNEPYASQIPENAATSTTVRHNDWIWAILILPIISLAFFTYVLIKWRHDNRPYKSKV